MSYNIDLDPPQKECEHCRRPYDSVDLDWSPTYNLTPIFDLALTGQPLPNPEISEGEVVVLGKSTNRPRGLRLLNGMKAGATVAALTSAVEDMKEKPDLFRALEPENRWGTYEGAIKVLCGLLELATKYPDHIWRIR